MKEIWLKLTRCSLNFHGSKIKFNKIDKKIANLKIPVKGIHNSKVK